MEEAGEKSDDDWGSEWEEEEWEDCTEEQRQTEIPTIPPAPVKVPTPTPPKPPTPPPPKPIPPSKEKTPPPQPKERSPSPPLMGWRKR